MTFPLTACRKLHFINIRDETTCNNTNKNTEYSAITIETFINKV